MVMYVKVSNYFGFNFETLLVEDQLGHYRRNQFVSSDMYNIKSARLKFLMNKLTLRKKEDFH